MELHTRCIDALRSRLAAILPGVSCLGAALFRDGLEELSTMETVLQQKQQQELRAIVGPYPILELATERLDSLRPPQMDNREWFVERPLDQLPGYPGHVAFGESLIQDIQSLPRSYDVVTLFRANRLASVVRGVGGQLSVPHSDGSVIIRTLSEAPPDLPPNRTEPIAVVHAARGWLSRDRASPTWTTAVLSAKSFIGLGLALGVFNYSRLFSRMAPRDGDTVDAFWQDESGNKYRPPPAFSSDEQDVLHDTQVSRTSLQTNGDEARRRLRGMATAFSTGEADARVRIAGVWHFLAYVGDNDGFRFLSTVVALEALLGSEEQSAELGLTRLLSERCAYLLGETEKDRRTIRDIVYRAYQRRSKLVHRGVITLSNEDEDLYAAARSLCARAIRRELQQ